MLAYAAGFMIATAMLHLAGLGTGFLIGTGEKRIVQLAGGLTAVAGVALLFGMV